MYQQSEERTVLAVSGVTISRKYVIIFQKIPGNINQDLIDKQNINKSAAVQANKREISYWKVLDSLQCDKFYLE